MKLIQEATQAGASRTKACEILNLDLRRLQRWEKNPTLPDQRRGPKTKPSHSLTEEEKEILQISVQPEYRDLTPWEMVAKLADSGLFVASEMSFYRVLKANHLLTHRSKSKPPVHRKPEPLMARRPNQVWCWDITYLKSRIQGIYYYLYLIEDLFSRKIVGWSVQECESAEHAAELIQQASEAEQIKPGQITLHSDNGSPMKGATMLVKLKQLGVMPSFSRPSVSNDNAYVESLFKTLKYRPSYPEGAFASLEEARQWVKRFVGWYNTEHLHRGIKYVTPQSRHTGMDKQMLDNRIRVYQLAKKRNPSRWSGKIRNWSYIPVVHLNPQKKMTKPNEMLRNQAA